MTISDLFAPAHAAGVLAVGGLLIGVAFGWTVYRTNFCVMGAMSDIYNLGDWRRLRAWVLAGAVAIVAAQVLRAEGLVPLERAMYLAPTLNWVGHAIGGAILGFGMVLTGGCPTRNLVRCGSGDLRSMVVLLVIAVAGFITIGGILAPARALVEQATAFDLKRLGLATQSAGALLSLSGLSSAARLDLVVAALAGAAGLIFAFRDHAFQTSPSHILSGIVVGLLVAAGWALTGLAYDEFAAQPTAPVSLTFIRPLGDTLDWLQRYTAIPVPGFGITTVAGTLLGACAASLASGRFRVLGFSDVSDLKANLIGATLMGVGGAMALGCTIGQGITGISTLALGSMITTAALVAGCFQGLKYLERSIDTD